MLRDLAKEIGLDVDKEEDLTRVAQYYVNEKRGVKTPLINKLLENFNKIIQSNINHKILASLPIDTFWTTNYDEIIEETLKFQDLFLFQALPKNFGCNIERT